MPEAILSLRAFTQEAHKALEATHLARDLMSPTLSLSRYRDIVQAWAQAWSALEAALQASAMQDICCELLPAPRCALAQQDLARLDALLHRPPVSDRAPLADCIAPLAPASSAAELLGMCYVAQGALLGGQVIARHVQTTLQLPPGCATQFFAPPQAPTLRWPDWTRAFNHSIRSPAELNAAQDGASRTFTYLRQAFDSEVVKRKARDTEPMLEQAS